MLVFMSILPSLYDVKAPFAVMWQTFLLTKRTWRFIPLPVYQRDAGWTELSTRTAIVASLPGVTRSVISYVNPTYPLGRYPANWPSTYTLLHAITPSNSRNKRSSAPISAFMVLRYQPIPVGRYAPPCPLGLLLSNSPSMLQSCGTSTVRQPSTPAS